MKLHLFSGQSAQTFSFTSSENIYYTPVTETLLTLYAFLLSLILEYLS